MFPGALAPSSTSSSSSAVIALRLAELPPSAFRSRFMGASALIEPVSLLEAAALARSRAPSGPRTPLLADGFDAAAGASTLSTAGVATLFDGNFILAVAAQGTLLLLPCPRVAPAGLPKKEAMPRCLPAGPDPVPMLLVARLSPSEAGRALSAP